MGLLWVLRSAGALRSGTGAAGAQPVAAAVDTASGTGSSPGSLRLSADRSQGLMRDLVTLLCASGGGSSRWWSYWHGQRHYGLALGWKEMS